MCNCICFDILELPKKCVWSKFICTQSAPQVITTAICGYRIYRTCYGIWTKI